MNTKDLLKALGGKGKATKEAANCLRNIDPSVIGELDLREASKEDLQRFLYVLKFGTDKERAAIPRFRIDPQFADLKPEQIRERLKRLNCIHPTKPDHEARKMINA